MLGRHRERYESRRRCGDLHEGLTHRRKQYERTLVMDRCCGSGPGRLGQYELDCRRVREAGATAVVWSRTKRYGARDAGAGSYLLPPAKRVLGRSEQIVADLLGVVAGRSRPTFRVVKTELGLRDLGEASGRIAGTSSSGARLNAVHRDPHAPEGARPPDVGRDAAPGHGRRPDDHHEIREQRTADRHRRMSAPANTAQIARESWAVEHHHRAHPPRPDPNTPNVVPVCWHPVL